MTGYNRSLEADKIGLSRDKAQFFSRLDELETTVSRLRGELDLVKADTTGLAERNQRLESEAALSNEGRRVFEEKAEERSRICEGLRPELEEEIIANDGLKAELEATTRRRGVLEENRELHYIDELDSKPYKVQVSRKQMSSDDYDASDLQDQRKSWKRHRVTSSHDEEVPGGRWRCGSILEESLKSHKQDDDAYEMERRRYTSSNLDDDRIGHFRDYRHRSRESSREHKSSYSRRKREKDREQELARKSERERERERERDRDKGRERKTEKARYGEREYGRERDREGDTFREREERRRKNRDRESRGTSRVGHRDIYSDRSSRQQRYDDLDDDASNLSWEPAYKGWIWDSNPNNVYHRHNRHYETDILRDRTADLSKAEKQKTVETESEKPKRDEVEQEDHQEKIAFQLSEQEEEEELERIKEESRRRRQAILEKYKHQPSQKEQMAQLGDNAEVHADQSTEKRAAGDNVLLEPVDGPTNGADVHVDEPAFSAGISPLKGGHNADEKASKAGGLRPGTPERARSGDMFSDDIFGESPVAAIRKMGKGDGLPIERSYLQDNCDDPEGYYSYRFGEILDGRYEILAAHGKGVFSTVVRAKDLKARPGYPEEVAIKIIRNNETMDKAGIEELKILNKLVGADPEGKRHCVRLISDFKYRYHRCLVFESLHMNLRELQKKFGRNIGLHLSGVRSYAKQLFSALKHLKSCSVLHCDIKPDNILVNEAKDVLKLCDFGNAMFAAVGKNDVTPYLVSHFYRAPEIILGLPYDHSMDIWSVGCCLFELYAGKILFPGCSNNEMLRLHMELKGPFPKKILRKGEFTHLHFDQDLNFLATEEDPVTKKAIKKLIVNIKPKDFSSVISGYPGENLKMLARFRDLMERIFVVEPAKRITASQALKHPFITTNYDGGNQLFPNGILKVNSHF
ncbi:uncharacterized protein LOC132606093 [Lycium barbarum]|uniref:uncharacterized protein LOC132606093 n=1 Tax=Lycium barbarum TaxID=112863 RepID=UPI00293F50D2|nr:uncharacterized protein LOC132606093 [Lycium barbarum]